MNQAADIFTCLAWCVGGRQGVFMLRFDRLVRATAGAAAALVMLAGPGPVNADTARDDNISFKKRVDPPARSSFVFTDHSVKPMLSADSAINLQGAIAKYEYIVRRGGWRKIPSGRTLVSGSYGDRVYLLRERLAMTGDLDNKAADKRKFDSSVFQAVRRFQTRMGIRATGVVDAAVLSALNVPARERLRTLEFNLSRVTEFSQGLGERYVVVNIPAAEIETVESDHVYSRHVAVVGKLDRQTPVISSQISELNFNPYWTVPASIVRKDLLPELRKDPAYLQRMNMRVHTDFGGPEVDPSNIDWNNVEEDTYVFRQDPGRINSMGSVKINFPNRHAVFLHDTPSKSLFAQAARLFSSGCVRVDKVHVLTEWLLRDNGNWSRNAIDQLAASGERLDVDLATPVQLRIVYMTAWAKSDGSVSFRPDIYNQDGTDLADAGQSQQTQ